MHAIYCDAKDNLHLLKLNWHSNYHVSQMNLMMVHLKMRKMNWMTYLTLTLSQSDHKLANLASLSG